MAELILKPKGKGHDPYTNRVRKDWEAAIRLHPDNFDAILRKTIPTEIADTDSDALFSNLNERVEDIQYQDPVIVSAVESTSEDESFFASFAGGESMGYGETSYMILRISDFDVPEGSSIEFNVSLANGEEELQSWYVLHSIAIGRPAIGIVHYCIPSGDVEHNQIPVIPNEPTTTVEEPLPTAPDDQLPPEGSALFSAE